MTLTVGGICSGIGMLEAAVEHAWDARTVWQCEPDRHATEVLAHHFPGVPNHQDVTITNWSEVEPVDIVCFGFPCQDLSYAGLGAGIREGTRSGLWYACWDAVRVLRPRWVVFENVAALVVRRPGFDVCAADMAADGYDFRWVSLRASEVGAPHRRDRVVCVAADTGGGRAGRFPRPVPGAVDRARWPGFGVHATVDDRRTAPDSVRWRDDGPRRDDPERFRVGPRPRDYGKYEPAVQQWESLRQIPAPCPTIPGKTRRRLNPELPEWMMGHPPGWTTATGIPVAAQLRCIGNSVCPQQIVAALTFLTGEPLDGQDDRERERERKREDFAADASDKRRERTGQTRDRRTGLEDCLLPTPTAWLGRRPSHAIGDPDRWWENQRSNELSDCIAHLYRPDTDCHDDLSD